LSPDSSGRLHFFPRRVEEHESDRRPVASGTAPALGIRSASALIELVTPREDAVFAATMTFVGCHEADSAMSMFAVIPADEALDPSPSGRTVGER
jgi:hypothetical protein